MPLPTIHDVAKEAGVSLATIDRVLNQRPGVRQSTIEKVESAIGKLNYVRNVNAANLAKSRSYTFLFILPSGDNSFMRDLELELTKLETHLSLDRICIEVKTVLPFDSTAAINAIKKINVDEISGVALVATDSPELSDAVDELQDKGIPVTTLVSDLPNSKRVHYAGINNIAAGRTAASLLGRFIHQPRGKVVIIAGSMLLRDHLDRHFGFVQVIQAEFPNIELLPIIEAQDDATTVDRSLTQYFEQYPDIVGIYNLGAGNRGLVNAMQKTNDGEIRKVVVHELTHYVRDALLNGTIDAALHQDAGHEVRSAIRVLKASLDGSAIDIEQERIRLEIYMRDNLVNI